MRPQHQVSIDNMRYINKHDRGEFFTDIVEFSNKPVING